MIRNSELNRTQGVKVFRMEQKNGDGNPSGTVERRRHPRISAATSVSYLLFDREKKKIDQGKGRTLNLSQGGALLETPRPLTGSYILLITIDLEGQKVQLKGRVANTRSASVKGRYLTGIEFIGPPEKQRDALVAFIKTLHRRRHADASKTEASPVKNPEDEQK